MKRIEDTSDWKHSDSEITSAKHTFSRTLQKVEGYSRKALENVVRQKIQKQPNRKVSLSCSAKIYLNLHVFIIFRGIVRDHSNVRSWCRRLVEVQVDFPNMLNARICSA